jgi:ribosomal protein L37AE/L43A
MLNLVSIILNSQVLHILSLDSLYRAKQLRHLENKSFMNTQASTTPMQSNHGTKMEPTKKTTASENQDSKHLCPQCNAVINWHLDGKYWHGECSGCALELSGKIHDSVQPAVLPEEHVCLSIRGC